ncbi:MAG TPA: CHAT domain-containing protein [Streptosporangiaceae bacterium]|nr:CHAT domain-containing protein [Streptosporangiaceae bacterium]
MAQYRIASGRLGEPGITGAHRWLIHSNMAKVLADMGQFRSAFKLLMGFVEHEPLSAWEQRRSFLDLGKYAEGGGLYDYAQSFLLAAWDSMQSESDFGHKRLELLTALTRSASNNGDYASSFKFAQQAAGLARNQGRRADEIDALISAARAAHHLGDPLWLQLADQAEQQIAVRTADGSSHADSHLLAARADLAALRGDSATLAELVATMPEPGAGRLTRLAQLLMDAGEIDPAGEAISRAWRVELDRALGDQDIDVRDFNTFSGSRLLRNLTARHALAMHREGRDAGLLLLRAAELDGTLLGSYLAWPADARPSPERLVDLSWLPEAACPARTTVVFVIYVERTAYFVVWLGASASVVLEWDADDLESVRSEVSAVTRRGSPRGNPLARSLRWLAFSEALGSALEPYTGTSAHLLFLFGTGLDNLPLHLLPTTQGLLIDVVPCSYAASLLQVAGLRERRQRWAGGARPHTSGIVSVYRGNELAKTAAAFSQGAAAWHRLLGTSAQAPPQILSGGQATPEAVLGLFAEVDLLLLSCHGLADPGHRLHSLLLASQGQLPPSIIRAIDDGGSPSSRYLLPWDAITEGTPAVVLSAACSSASATVASSGERISLDRALCANGTSTFIGPLWDVSVADSHAFIAEVVRNAREQEISWVDAWRRAAADCRATMAPATWHSFVLIGDWT